MRMTEEKTGGGHGRHGKIKNEIGLRENMIDLCVYLLFR